MSSRKDMVSHGKAHKRNEYNRGEIPLKPIEKNVKIPIQ